MLSGDDLATAITNGGSNWMILSVAAVLPIIWGFTLALHFARPYVLRFLQTLTLRFGGDVWWLSYVLTRDALLVVTLCLSVIFLFPNVYLRGDGAGITAPLATLVLFWATLVKLIRDPDDSPSDFRLQSLLLVIASALYIIPQIYGMEAADQDLGAWSSEPHLGEQPGPRPRDPVGVVPAVRHHECGGLRPVPAGARQAG